MILATTLLIPGCFGGDSSDSINPTQDSDGDGLYDSWERENGLDPLDASDAPACQGAVIFCMRTYDNFTFPETHNSFATTEDGVIYPASNHQTALAAQWAGGIRAYMIDTHHKSSDETEKEDVRFCHGDPDSFFHPCTYSEVDAFEWLDELRGLMDNSPNDVVTILIENYVPREHLSYLFNQSNLTSRTWIHPPGEEWPTLGEMVLSERNLVVFIDETDNASYPWLHHAWTHSWDTPYGQQDEEDMSCEVGRGDGEQPVWHLNNWLNNAAGAPDYFAAQEVNDHDKLLARALECWEEVGDRPTFIAVDWWDEGDVVGVVNDLNQMSHWTDSAA